MQFRTLFFLSRRPGPGCSLGMAPVDPLQKIGELSPRQCQSAFNRDPLSARKRDPLGGAFRADGGVRLRGVSTSGLVVMVQSRGGRARSEALPTELA